MMEEAEQKVKEEQRRKTPVKELKDTDPMGAHIDALFPGAGATPLQVISKPPLSVQSPKPLRKGVKGPILLCVHSL